MYKVVISKKATKYLARLDTLQRERIYSKIQLLGEGLFDRLDIKVMQGFSDIWRLRIGAVRVIYRKEDDTLYISIIDIGSR